MRTEAWIVPFRVASARPPLFCVCAGGGDVFDYQDLALALPDDQPVYVFGVPPFAASEGFPTVQRLASIYVQEVVKRQPHGPYRLCGHSFGGLVVYEMAVLLSGAGEEVGLLALIDTLHPAFRSSMSPEQRRQFQATYVADRIAKYRRNLVSGRLDRIAGDIFDFVWHRCKRTALQLARTVFDRLDRPVPEAIRSDELILLAAWHRYNPSPYAGRLMLLNASDRPPEYGSDGTLGWKTCVSGTIDVQVVTGNHYTIMHRPHVRELSERIVRSLVAA
ncbi:MAG TPA: alpha/beta fold hydrolase [Acetobacteraceae bacterium]|nr:alpha/beta fold hydrolase [Acetobacteraceae bacterium]